MAKILLVEDNEMNRDMLSRRLARRGYEMVIAVDGQQGKLMSIKIKSGVSERAISMPCWPSIAMTTS